MPVSNLVPKVFGKGERKKTLASADHVIFKHPEKLGVIISSYRSYQRF